MLRKLNRMIDRVSLETFQLVAVSCAALTLAAWAALRIQRQSECGMTLICGCQPMSTFRKALIR